jgi:hypothetical protein
MKKLFYAICILLFLSAEAKAEIELPESVVQAYVRITDEQAINRDADWELLISYAANHRLQPLLLEKQAELLGAKSYSLLSVDNRLLFLKWEYEKALFELNNWPTVEDKLIKMGA